VVSYHHFVVGVKAHSPTPALQANLNIVAELAHRANETRRYSCSLRLITFAWLILCFKTDYSFYAYQAEFICGATTPVASFNV
jgi:hypothetical protein